MKKRAVSPNPSPLARFFPPFEAGNSTGSTARLMGRQPVSKERTQKRAARKFRASNQRNRSGFTKPTADRERRIEINHYVRCQDYHRAAAR